MTRAGRWSRIILATAIVVGLGIVFWALGARSDWEPRPIVGVSGSPESSTLEVTVAHEFCGTGDPRVEVVDRTDTVVLSAEFDIGDGNCDSVGLQTTVDVDLDRALGDRAVEAQLARDLNCDIAGANSDRCVETAGPG